MKSFYYTFPCPPWNTTDSGSAIYLEFAVQFAHPKFVKLVEQAYDLRKKLGYDAPQVKEAYECVRLWEKGNGGSFTVKEFTQNKKALEKILKKYEIRCTSHGSESQKFSINAENKKGADEKIRDMLSEVSKIVGLEVILTSGGRIANPRFKAHPSAYPLCMC